MAETKPHETTESINDEKVDLEKEAPPDCTIDQSVIETVALPDPVVRQMKSLKPTVTISLSPEQQKEEKEDDIVVATNA